MLLLLCLIAELALPRDLMLQDGAQGALGGVLAEAASATVLAVRAEGCNARTLSERQAASCKVDAVSNRQPAPPTMDS